MAGQDHALSPTRPGVNRAGTRSRPGRTESSENTAALDELLGYAARQGASDVVIIAGAPVALRVEGKLTASAGPVLAAEDTRNLLLPLLTPAQAQELQRNKSIDFCFSRDQIGRFRANVHHQRGMLAGSIRLLPARIPTLDSLHLPGTLAPL